MRPLLLIFSFLLALPAYGQSYSTYQNCHSHNDYERERPLYEALEAGFASIEADIFVVDGELYVAHDREDIRPERTLRAMYLEPLAREAQRGGGSVYSDGHSLQLLIDLKTGYEETLPVLTAMLEQYNHLFDLSLNPSAVKVVVSGSMPPPEEFKDYPSSIWFDGRPKMDYSETAFRRIAMISASYSDYLDWNGTGKMPRRQQKELVRFVNDLHEKGARVRLWGCPDTPEA